MLQAITTVLQAALRVKHVTRAPAKKAIKQYGTLLCNVAPSCGETGWHLFVCPEDRISRCYTVIFHFWDFTNCQPVNQLSS